MSESKIKSMNKYTANRRNRRKNKGCLPDHGGFVAKSQSTSFSKKKAAWKAGTLPTELLPQNLPWESLENHPLFYQARRNFLRAPPNYTLLVCRVSRLADNRLTRQARSGFPLDIVPLFI